MKHKHLVEQGLLQRRQYSERPPRYEYLPTQAALDFEPVLRAMLKWGLKWTTPPEAETWTALEEPSA